MSVQATVTPSRCYVTVLALRIAVVREHTVGPPEPVQGAVKRMQREQGADGRQAGGGLPGGPAGAHPRTPSLQRTGANVRRLILMALCGVGFPRALFLQPIPWL